MTTRLWMVVLATVCTSASLYAQQPGGGSDVWQRYQDKLAPVADYAVTMATLSGGHSFTSRMWRLTPKTRMEMEAPGMGSMAVIVDPEAANDQGGKGLSYMLFLSQKMYRKTALSAAQADKAKADADIKVEELGQETINNLVCDKRRVTVTEAATKQAHVILLWVSSFVHNMPVQMESTERGVPLIIQFRDYNFEKPAASLFVVPADFAAMGGGMFPGMPGGAVPGTVSALPETSAAPAIPVTAAAAPVTVQAGGVQVVLTTNAAVVPSAPVVDPAEAAKQAAKDAANNAAQEGVSRGLRKVFGW